MIDVEHAPQLTVANSGARLILCSCGWASSAHPVPADRKPNSVTRHPEIAEAAAFEEHRRHVRDQLA